MNELQVQMTVGDIVRDVLEQPSLVLDENTVANQVEGWDSLNHINIVVAVEQRFGIKFKTGEIESLRDFGDLVNLTNRKIIAKG